MKLLHTSDWHVGKTIRGHSRAEEHRAVLDEIVAIARDEEVDLVVIAGDLFDTAAPSAESEEIVYRALLGLRGTGAAVAVVSGNHDDPGRLAAVAPVLDALGLVVVPRVARPADGGVVEVSVRDGSRVRLALLPFLSQRGIVRIDDLMRGDAVSHVQKYAERYRNIVGALCAPLSDDLVNVVVAHTFVDRALSGGGERPAHVGGDYAVPAGVFPSHVHYVALGHLHRPQRIEGATQIHYCGSPLQLDFGEIDQPKQVNLVEARLGAPARVTPVRLRSGRPLRTVRATLDALAGVAGDLADAWVRVEVQEPARAGLADEVRALVPTAVDVTALPADARGDGRARERRIGRSPHELFDAFCAERNYDDVRVRSLFAELFEELGAPAAD